ncbi:MAG TPA: SynChlorMet cassette radical SAM/SPASM protein ScmF [Desulfomonilaceae bacterium]|nr:SynChlorMet cassette radical SAM/SPASM protein ScmF [Desulfomonilaceae bacterium]
MQEEAPPLNQIYFYLTQGCNLRCRHCWIVPKFQGTGEVCSHLKLEVFRSILDQAKPLGLQAVKLTGGEPLIHPHIHDIIDTICEEQLSLGVETNGVECTSAIAAKLAASGNPFVSVSLDGTDAKTHEWVRGVEGCFDAALAGIRNLVDAHLKPQIIMTVMKRNSHQVEALVSLAEGIGAGSVKFNLVQPTARGEQLHHSQETLSMPEILELGRYVETELRSSANVPLFFSHPEAFRPLGNIFGNDGNGCSVCGIFGILGVLGDGTYALCGIGETVPELAFGHAEKDRLETVWKHNPILQSIREGLPKRLKGICGDCIMKSRCLGSCIAQNYYRDKDFWAPNWFCEEAYKLGLFPESRIRGRVPVRSGA